MTKSYAAMIPHILKLTASVYTLSDSRIVAKVEKKSSQSSLLPESKVYRRLSGVPCVPRFYFFGEESGYYGLILEHVGHNMEDFFRLKKKLVLDIDSSSLAAVVAVEMVCFFTYGYRHIIANADGDWGNRTHPLPGNNTL